MPTQHLLECKDWYITASGDLAAGFPDRHDPCRIYFRAYPAELKKCRELLRGFTGQHPKCGKCGRMVRICRNPGSETTFHVAHDGNSTTECDWLSRRTNETLIELDTFGEYFAAPRELNGIVSLRLRHLARLIDEKWTKGLSGGGGTSATQREEVSEHSLLGLLGLLVEIPGFNRWSPGRKEATQFLDLMPFLARCARTAAREGFFPSFGPKLVFAEGAEDSAGAVEVAANATGCVGKLDGQAIVIGRICARPQFTDGRVDIMLAGMRASPLSVEGDRKGGLWKALEDSCGFPLAPSEKTGAETLFIARVVPEEGRYQILEAAWGRINRFGLLSKYRYAYEPDTAEELIRLGVCFMMGPMQRMKVGSRALLVDFVVEVWDIALKMARWVIVEVDPKKSANRKPSKVQRVGTCNRANVRSVSYDPVRDKKGILEVLLENGFRPL